MNITFLFFIIYKIFWNVFYILGDTVYQPGCLSVECLVYIDPEVNFRQLCFFLRQNSILIFDNVKFLQRVLVKSKLTKVEINGNQCNKRNLHGLNVTRKATC